MQATEKTRKVSNHFVSSYINKIHFNFVRCNFDGTLETFGPLAL